jgi:hypothetical protein
VTGGADDAVNVGREAWARLWARDRKAWSDWVLVGHELIAGRAEAMRQANANRPLGSKYNRLFGEWLRSHGFDGIPGQTRYRTIKVIENIREIEVFRDGLTEAQRLRWNHPNSVWAHWRRSLKAATPAPQRQHYRRAHRGGWRHRTTRQGRLLAAGTLEARSSGDAGLPLE